MDDGPGTALGTLGWFVGVWVVMMAAMMFPSVAPAVRLYARLAKRRDLLLPVSFASGYLLAWAAVGVLAFGASDAGRRVFGAQLEWHRGGRALAGGVLLVAAVYELTPLKTACLSRCRSPLGFLLGSWRDGVSGALSMGARHGAWCVACCWALMASLFALGVMSITWMVFVAGLVAIEKLLPWPRAATVGTALVLIVLGLLLIVSPGTIPGLTIPGHGGMMGGMTN
jgi:predicted metal-binding membrane protein